MPTSLGITDVTGNITISSLPLKQEEPVKHEKCLKKEK